jgi:hypothetical protein
MLKKGCVLLLGGLLVMSFSTGCGNNISIAKGKKWESSKINLETIMTLAFDNVTWAEGQNVLKEKVSDTAFGMDESLKNQVVVKGKISQKLHDYMLDRMKKGNKLSPFAEALRYIAKLNKDGKLAQGPDAKFDIKQYPYNEKGDVDVDKAESFLLSPENKDKVDALMTYFSKKFWETGTDVTIVFSLAARGKVVKVPAANGVFWDNDSKYTDHTSLVMNDIFEFAQNNLPQK